MAYFFLDDLFISFKIKKIICFNLNLDRLGCDQSESQIVIMEKGGTPALLKPNKPNSNPLKTTKPNQTLPSINHSN
jgi:hypothetical protein